MRLILCVLTLLLLITAPAVAQTSSAGLVSAVPGVAPDTIDVKAVTATGETMSKLRVLSNPFVIIVSEDGDTDLKAGPGCRESATEASPVRVICENKFDSGKAWGTFALALGGGRDTLFYKGSGPSLTISGGTGDDRLEAEYTGDPSYGLEPSTYPHAPIHADGGEGADEITLVGFPYTATGGPGADTLTGTWKEGRLDGGSGNDRLTLNGGGTGAGGTGDDVLRVTGSGLSTLLGGPGDDRISGGKGRDVVSGGSGYDRVLTGAGNDLLLLRDGEKDVANCGGGTDQAQADSAAVDKTLLICETVRRTKARP